jgi:hypothetical protein
MNKIKKLVLPYECVDEQFKGIVCKLDAKISPEDSSQSFFCVKPICLYIWLKPNLFLVIR